MIYLFGNIPVFVCIRLTFFGNILVFSFKLLDAAGEYYQREVKTSWQVNSERDETFTLHLGHSYLILYSA